MQELRGLVDEDSLMPAPSLGEPHYVDIDEPTGCPTCGDTHNDEMCPTCGDAHDDYETGCGAPEYDRF